MLQDRGSQYKAHRGEADYQYYARLLGIELKYANKARTKGKIERFWRFVQQDFVGENLEVDSVEALNRRFFAWQGWFNYRFRSNGLERKRSTSRVGRGYGVAQAKATRSSSLFFPPHNVENIQPSTAFTG